MNMSVIQCINRHRLGYDKVVTILNPILVLTVILLYKCATAACLLNIILFSI